MMVHLDQGKKRATSAPVGQLALYFEPAVGEGDFLLFFCNSLEMTEQELIAEAQD